MLDLASAPCAACQRHSALAARQHADEMRARAAAAADAAAAAKAEDARERALAAAEAARALSLIHI